MHLLTNMDWWEWACLSFIFGSPFLLGFLDAFKTTSQSTTSQNLLYENSFNQSTSEIQNLDGSTQITVGPARAQEVAFLRGFGWLWLEFW